MGARPPEFNTTTFEQPVRYAPPRTDSNIMTILTADELAGLNFHDLGEAVRSRHVSPDAASDETLYRQTLTIAAVNRG
jgi:hypothetical protein